MSRAIDAEETGISFGSQHVGRPLLTPDEVRTLREDLQLLFLAGQRPIVADAFDLPPTRGIDVPLAAGAVIFGVGWGISGLCPGPAIAGLALAPSQAIIAVAARGGGMLLHRLTSR